MHAITLPITLVTAGGAGIINFWLALRVGQVRRADKVSIGDGGNVRLIARMRAQANFVEYAPFVLILIGLIEFSTGPSLWLWAASALFLIARIAHPLGMDGLRYARSTGIALTFVVLLGLAIYAVVLPFEAPRGPAPISIDTLPPQG